MTRRILLCDDEIHIVRAAEIKLRHAGYEVTRAADGEEAWQLIKQDVPHLLVTDIAMPRVDGFQLCERIRQDESTHDLPIFLLTGKGYEFSHSEVAEKWGIREIIVKPFSPADLVRRVDRLFRDRSPQLASCGVAVRPADR